MMDEKRLDEIREYVKKLNELINEMPAEIKVGRLDAKMMTELLDALIEAREEIARLNDVKCEACRLISVAYGYCELGKFECLVEKGIWSSCKIGKRGGGLGA